MKLRSCSRTRRPDRKSTRLNSSHSSNSYAVFCLKKKNGSPMGAEGFVTQAGHFTDRTVVTYDPRGAGRSKRTDGASETTVEEQADDLHRLIDALGAGPVDIFASSGGAVNALALVARHPEQVCILVAHEPPAAQELPDRQEALATCEAIHE